MFETDADREAERQRFIQEQFWKAEREERIINFFKAVTFPPLNMFFRVIAFVGQIAGAISVFLTFYGLYNGYKFFAAYQQFVTIGDFSLLKSCIGYCVLPFVIYGLKHVAEILVDALETEI